MPQEPKLGDWRSFLNTLQANEGYDIFAPKKSFIAETDVQRAPHPKYDEGLNLAIDDPLETRMGNQTAWDAAGSAFVHALSTAGLEMPEGFGYIGMAVANKLKGMVGEDSDEFLDLQNSLSTWAKGVKSSLTTANPIYVTKEDELFDPFSAMSWANNAGSIGSTFSLMLPGIAAGKIGTKATIATANRIAKYSKLGKLAASATTLEATEAAIRAASTLAKRKGIAGDVAGTLSATLASRHAENMLEATGAFDQSLTEDLMRKYSMGYEEASIMSAQLLANPDMALNSKFKEEFLKGAEAAAKTARWNWLAGSLDLVQYATTFTGIGKFLKFKNIPKSTTTKWGKLQNLGKRGWNASKNLGINMASEALEEGYQSIITAEALRGGEMFSNGFGDRLDDYIQDEEVQSAMLMGAAMGGGFHTIGNLIKKANAGITDYGIRLETAAIMKDPNAAANIIDGKLAAIMVRDIKLNGNLNNVVKALDKIDPKGENSSQEFTATKAILNSINDSINSLAGEVDTKGNTRYNESQLARIASAQFMANKSSLNKETIDAHIDGLYKELVDAKHLTPEQATIHEKVLRKAAIDHLLKVKRGTPSKAEADTLAALKEESTKLGAEIKDASELPSTIKDKELIENIMASLSQEVRRAYYQETVEALQTDKGMEEAGINATVRQNESIKRVMDMEKNNYFKRIHNASDIKEIADTIAEEAESTGDSDNSTRAVRVATKNAKKQINKILKGLNPEEGSQTKLTPEEQANYLQKVLEGSPAAMYGIREDLKELLGDDVEIPSDALGLAITILKHTEKGTSPSGDVMKYFDQPTSYTEVNTDVIEEYGSLPDVNSEPNNYDVNNELNKIEDIIAAIEDSPSTVGMLLHYRHSGGVLITDSEGNPVPHPLMFSQAPDGDLHMELHLDPDFNPTNQEVSYVVDSEDEYNVTHSKDGKLSPMKAKISMYVTHKGKPVYIGMLNEKENSKNIREDIINEYNNRPAGTQKFTASIKGKVLEKLPGRITNTSKSHTLRELALASKSPVYLMTTRVSKYGDIFPMGLNGLPGDVKLSKSFSLYGLAKNAQGEAVGGYLYILIKSANGTYLPVRAFTPKISEHAPSLEKALKLIDELYSKDREVQANALSDLKEFAHINRPTSRAHLSVINGRVAFAAEEKEERVLIGKEALTDIVKGLVLHINGDMLNKPGYNEQWGDVLMHNANLNAPIDSPSYRVELYKTEPKVPEETENDFDVYDDIGNPIQDLETTVQAALATGTTPTTSEETEASSSQKILETVFQMFENKEGKTRGEKMTITRKISSELQKDKNANFVYNNLKAIYKALDVELTGKCP